MVSKQFLDAIRSHASAVCALENRIYAELQCEKEELQDRLPERSIARQRLSEVRGTIAKYERGLSEVRGTIAKYERDLVELRLWAVSDKDLAHRLPQLEDGLVLLQAEEERLLAERERAEASYSRQEEEEVLKITSRYRAAELERQAVCGLLMVMEQMDLED
jgi:chromosome segregation ATPase